MKKSILKLLITELEGIMPDNKIRDLADELFEISEDMVGGFKESINSEIEDSEENQEQGQRPKYHQGKIDASEYAIEMIDKHLNMY